MSEAEIQQKFRDQVLRDLASEQVKLDDLAKRVSQLEQTVVHGNGHKPLTAQVSDLEAKIDSLSDDVEHLRGEMNKITELNNNVIAIKTQLELKKESNGYFVGFLIALVTALVTVGGTALVQHFIH